MWDFDLSVTICSWNTRDELAACLASIEAVREEARFETIVVENNSQDGSGQMVKEQFPWVVLHEMPRNLGFTGGHNFAIEHRRGRHAFLLNSDAVVHPGCLAALLQYLKQDSKVGIVGPKVLNPDGSIQLSCRRFPNPRAAMFRNTFLGRWFPKNRYTREYLMADWSHDEPRYVDWVSGCAMLATEEMIAQVGLMDPAYFMYCEDVDWCFRARQAGFEVAYLPAAVVTHSIGRSTDKAPNRMIVRFHRSMFYFYRKNMLQQSRPIFRPFKLILAFFGLSLRAALFIVMNKIDVVRRWRQRGAAASGN